MSYRNYKIRELRWEQARIAFGLLFFGYVFILIPAAFYVGLDNGAALIFILGILPFCISLYLYLKRQKDVILTIDEEGLSKNNVKVRWVDIESCKYTWIGAMSFGNFIYFFRVYDKKLKRRLYFYRYQSTTDDFQRFLSHLKKHVDVSIKTTLF